ncbi:hypothetical protein RN001_003310 [Aquatica leii]|uniref:Uncharacterized protein n=1 Tax=Aquatica leii TaxID=1421715 RepID=A0AAN7SM85_9COLE|nr:hypothetical protein RN001_003310 [Aquatica leii]
MNTHTHSTNPNQWLKWLKELESEDENSEIEGDDDYLDEDDTLDESDHKSESEQDGDDSDEENVVADEDENITCYIGKDGTTWKKKCPPVTRTRKVMSICVENVEKYMNKVECCKKVNTNNLLLLIISAKA